MRRRGVGRAGRPGLIGTAARTAVIAGTATAVSGNVAQRQAARAQAAQAPAAQVVEQASPPPAAAAPGGLTDDAIARLKELASLRDQGILTDAEFDAQKAAILG